MLSFPPGVQVFLAVAAVDMRKSFDGLTAAVESVFERNVLDGHLFLFLNRRRDRIKILWWDRDGLAIWAKRLEAGSFEMPRHEAGAQRLQLEATQLALLLSGVQLDAPQRPRYVRPPANTSTRQAS